MFTDRRGKQIALVSHCLLNQNSISDGTADFPSQFEEIVALLMANRIGIIQLPCPELTCLGLDRQDARGAERELLAENSRIRNLLLREENTARLRDKAREIAAHLQDYRRHGFEIVGVVGVNRSPSCGIQSTSIDGKEQPGMGVFMQVLAEELQKADIPLPMVGVKTSRIEESVEAVRRLIAGIGSAAG